MEKISTIYKDKQSKTMKREFNFKIYKVAQKLPPGVLLIKENQKFWFWIA